MIILIIVGVVLILLGFYALEIVGGEVGGTTFACICLASGIIILILTALSYIMKGGIL